MKAPLIVALLLLGSCTALGHKMPECWRVRTKRGHASSVPIVQRGAKLWLLTAKHILPAYGAGGRHIVDVIKHPSRDIALISVFSIARYLPPMVKEAPTYGAKLFAAGYQNGALLMTSGYQAEYSGRMSCPVGFGASGGPVWNTAGELVGVCESVTIMPSKTKKYAYTFPHISFYASVVGLKNWIADNTK